MSEILLVICIIFSIQLLMSIYRFIIEIYDRKKRYTDCEFIGNLLINLNSRLVKIELTTNKGNEINE